MDRGKSGRPHLGPCVVEGCRNWAQGRNLCGGHRARIRRYGDVRADIPLKEPGRKGRICSVEGCVRPFECKGYCVKHYYYWSQYGDPLAPRRKRSRTPEEFRASVFERIDENGPVSRRTGSPCWLWTGCFVRGGYGVVRNGARNSFVHRLTYEWLVGPVPEGMDLDHVCRTRRCVNPAHLEPVTRKENVARGIAALRDRCPSETCEYHNGFPEVA